MSLVGHTMAGEVHDPLSRNIASHCGFGGLQADQLSDLSAGLIEKLSGPFRLSPRVGQAAKLSARASKQTPCFAPCGLVRRVICPGIVSRVANGKYTRF